MWYYNRCIKIHSWFFSSEEQSKDGPSLHFTTELSILRKRSLPIVKMSWNFADLLDYRMEYSLKKMDLLCLDAKLINSIWLFHMVKPITTLFDFFHLCWGYRISLMLPAALFSFNTNSRGKKKTHWFSCFPLSCSYSTAKANVKQAFTITAFSQMPF